MSHFMALSRTRSRDVVLEPLVRAADAPTRSQQVYGTLRALVLSGRLRAGDGLPSSRTLAATLGVARNTVLAAIERLCAEELVVCARGSGCRVATPTPVARDTRLAPPHEGGVRSTRPEGPSVRPRAFTLGLPALEEFPLDLWARLVRRQWRAARPSLLGYPPPGGYRPLREAIAAHLRATRAVSCGWTQVIITPGVRPALALAARAVLRSGDAVWVEDPGYAPGARVFELEGLRVVPVDVDHEGLSVASGMARAPRARAAYVTPSHQFPLGVTMSLARRLELLRWAATGSRWIIEDDYDSEFRHLGPPLASLQGLDAHRRVIYVGTFSKILVPAIRVAYAVVPERLVDAFVTAQSVGDRHAALVDQATLADFIGDGHFARHQRRMRRLYASRREALLTALRASLMAEVDVSEPEAGLHVVAWLNGSLTARTAARAAQAAGLDVRPLQDYSRRRLRRQGLLLGYGAVHERLIREGVRDLARVLKTTVVNESIKTMY